VEGKGSEVVGVGVMSDMGSAKRVIRRRTLDRGSCGSEAMCGC
jgi:hypothetical protein